MSKKEGVDWHVVGSAANFGSELSIKDSTLELPLRGSDSSVIGVV